TAVECLRGARAAPIEQLAVGVEKRLDREAALLDLEHALFVEQRVLLVAVDADDGPVRLLAVEVLGKLAGRRLRGQRLEELVRRVRELERLAGAAEDAVA